MDRVTEKDERFIRCLTEDTILNHISGSSYEMQALWVKGKRRVKGSNLLSEPARRHHDVYPEIHGRHCELHVWVRAERAGISLKGGTLYITGANARNRNVMANTAPCKHCRFVLQENTKISALVYYKDGILVKETWK